MVVPVLSWVSNQKDGSIITIKDATGAYNGATNTGGYGTPNANEPTEIGIRARYWGETLPYGYLVTDSSPVIAALLGDGYGLTLADLGSTATAFTPGVHHLLYYPLETIDTKVTLTNGSALVTVTEGTTPDTWAVGYKGIVFLPSGSLDTKVYLIDRTKTISDTQFYLTEVWTGDTEEAVVLRIAPEADLKVLAKETTEFCIVSEIGKMGASCSCDDGKEYDLMRLLMWLFAAQVNFDCKDYSAAHNKVVAAYMECTNCKKPCLCS